MSSSIKSYLKDSAELIEKTATSFDEAVMEKAISLCVDAILAGKPILVCGNGGSASDAMHIAGELEARFLMERKGMHCICLSANPAMITAWSNDYDFSTVYERGVEAHGCEGAVLLGISTSGTSKNVVLAAQKAKAMGMHVISMTGEGGGMLAGLSDALLDAPSKVTAMIQQVHICMYHYLCAELERRVAESQG